MSATRQIVIRAGFEVLFATGAHVLMRPFVGGVGAILTLHHVVPPRTTPFQPNRLLEVTPEFLEEVIGYLRRARVDLVSIDEVHRRLTERDFGRRFVCFTFDDGYRDNLEYALPILKRHGVPFTLYVPTSFPDHVGELWWAGLEEVIAAQPRISLRVNGTLKYVDCATTEGKARAFADVYWALRALDSEEDLRDVVRELCARYGVDLAGMCRDRCMPWTDIARMAEDPLVTIGAHTVNHVMLRKCSDGSARSEMRTGAAVIESALGRPVRHFAYPVGDRTSAGPREFALASELGFKTAVTTRPGVLFPEHAEHLTSMPRLSLNGDFQKLRYAKVLVSGAASAVWNRLRRVHAP